MKRFRLVNWLKKPFTVVLLGAGVRENSKEPIIAAEKKKLNASK